MKRIPSIVAIVVSVILPALLQAQEKQTLPNPYLVAPNTAGEALRFIPDPDSVAPFNIGWVETVSGKQILRTGLGNYTSYFDENNLLTGIFVLCDPQKPADTSADNPMRFNYSLLAFNQKGELLYHPFWYDNGPDYFVEGRSRYVENGKMGLVNRLGEKVIPARKYRFLNTVHNGYLLACKDCRYYVYDSTDVDHGAGYKGTAYDILDKNGNLLTSFQLPENAERGAAYQKMLKLIKDRRLPAGRGSKP